MTTPLPTEAESTYVVNLGGDLGSIPGALGAATDAVLAGRTTTLLLDAGDNAVHPALLGPLHRWSARNETLFRTRVRAMAIEVPRFWHWLQWWIVGFVLKTPVPVTAFRSREKAVAWLSARR